MKLSVVKGATSVLVRIFIQDSSSTTGAGLTGLVFNTAGLTCYRMRDDDGNAGGTVISLATATLGTWATGGFKEKDATNCPGWYEFGIPNAAVATGSRSVDFHFKGATNMAPLPVEIELTGWDNQDAVHGGLSAVPNATAGASNGLLIAGSNAATTFSGLTTGALSCTTITASGAVAFQSTFAVTTSTSLAALSCSTLTASGAVAFQSTFAVTTSTSLAALSCSTLTASGAVAFQSTFATTGTTTFNAFTVTNATTLSGAVSLGSTLGITGTTTLAALTTTGTMTVNAFTCTNNFTVSGNWLTTGTTTWTGAGTFTAGLTSAITGSITGNLSGSVGSVTGAVGSVTGAVGSVTGNVGGNVTGTVGSVVTKTGYALASNGLDSIVVETGVNARQALSIVAAADSGVLAGVGTGTITIAAAANPATNRISATVDATGRSAVTLSLPA